MRSSPAITISSVDFSRARRPDQADAFTAVHEEVDAAQHMNARRAGAQGQVDLLQADDGFTQGEGTYIAAHSDMGWPL
jgi:hypothetical protein